MPKLVEILRDEATPRHRVWIKDRWVKINRVTTATMKQQASTLREITRLAGARLVAHIAAPWDNPVLQLRAVVHDKFHGAPVVVASDGSRLIAVHVRDAVSQREGATVRVVPKDSDIQVSDATKALDSEVLPDVNVYVDNKFGPWDYPHWQDNIGAQRWEQQWTWNIDTAVKVFSQIVKWSAGAEFVRAEIHTDGRISVSRTDDDPRNVAARARCQAQEDAACAWDIQWDDAKDTALSGLYGSERTTASAAFDRKHKRPTVDKLQTFPRVVTSKVWNMVAATLRGQHPFCVGVNPRFVLDALHYGQSIGAYTVNLETLSNIKDPMKLKFSPDAITAACVIAKVK